VTDLRRHERRTLEDEAGRPFSQVFLYPRFDQGPHPSLMDEQSLKDGRVTQARVVRGNVFGHFAPRATWMSGKLIGRGAIPAELVREITGHS